MGCIALVGCLLVLRCGLAGVECYPDAGRKVGLSLFNYQDDVRSNEHKINKYTFSSTSIIQPTTRSR